MLGTGDAGLIEVLDVPAQLRDIAPRDSPRCRS